MHYDPSTRSMSFSSEDEMASFHQELTHLLRVATVAASTSEQDAAKGREAAQTVLKEFRTVTRALNTLRRILPRATR